MLSTKIQRFYSLDALRGFAALSVVFWHWQHFYFIDGLLGPIDADRLPFHRVASVFYARGWLAVEMFFTISGFIFFWLYADAISAGKLGWKRFSFLRFSRLWPLYIATLLLVAILQIAYFRQTSTFFVYPYNGPLQFVQHLLALSAWTDRGFHSFNGPAWSISVEVFLYFLFFLVCRFLPVRVWLLLAIVGVGQVLYEKAFLNVVRGIEPFFMGGLMFHAYRAITSGKRIVAWTWGISCVTVCAWVLGLALMFSSVTSHSLVQLFFLSRFEYRVKLVFADWPRLVLFPMLVLALALIEHQRGSLGKRIAFVGDISYSSYLLHFPIQLIAVLMTGWLGLDRGVFYLPSTMIAFFIVLLGVSFLSHRFFEMPAQSYIRSKFFLVAAPPGRVTT